MSWNATLHFLEPGEPWLASLLKAPGAVAAPFAGAFFAFLLHGYRSRWEERKTFGRLVEGVLIESTTNLGILGRILRMANVGYRVGEHVRTEALQAALRNPLVLGLAPASLTKALLLVNESVRHVNSLLPPPIQHLEFARTNSTSRLDDLDKLFESWAIGSLEAEARRCHWLIVEALQPEIAALPKRLRLLLLCHEIDWKPPLASVSAICGVAFLCAANAATMRVQASCDTVVLQRYDDKRLAIVDEKIKSIRDDVWADMPGEQKESQAATRGTLQT